MVDARTALLVAGIVCSALSPIACRKPADRAHGDAMGPSITRTAQQDSVSVILSVTPESPELSRIARVTVDILADSSVTVVEPDYGKVLTRGDRAFEYRLTELQPQRATPLGDGRLQWRYTYELRFVLPGDYELPGVDVAFTTIGPDDQPTESTLTTEPISLSVTGPAESPLTNEELRTVTRLDPVDLPWSWSRSGSLAAALVAALVLCAGLLFWRMRGRREKTEIPIPADIWARRQLDALVAEGLLEAGRVQEFYYRISAIVRGYIERRFAVSAPEMTTEEFLHVAASDARFTGETRAELDRFLRACDLVKYAKHLPGRDECEAVLFAARNFVEHTRPRITPDDSANEAVRANAGVREECAA